MRVRFPRQPMHKYAKGVNMDKRNKINLLVNQIASEQWQYGYEQGIKETIIDIHAFLQKWPVSLLLAIMENDGSSFDTMEIEAKIRAKIWENPKD